MKDLFKIYCVKCRRVVANYGVADNEGWKVAGEPFRYACPECSPRLYVALANGGGRGQRALFSTDDPKVALQLAVNWISGKVMARRPNRVTKIVLMVHRVSDGSIQSRYLYL